MVHKMVHGGVFLKNNYIHKRGNRFIYRRRIPSEVAHLDPRKEIKISLKTSDYNEAVIRTRAYNQQIENFWASLVHNKRGSDFGTRYKAAVKLAQAHGFSYKSIDQVAESHISEIVDRLSVEINSKQKVEALLGGAGESDIMLSNCIDLYWNLINDRLQNKSDHQIRKWKNPRKAALIKFIETVGDKRLQEVTRRDILAFRESWNVQLGKGYSSVSANKQLRFVRDILQLVAINNEIDIDFEPLFAKTNFRNNSRSRPPFEASFVQNTLLPKLESFNARDRAVIMAMADTGGRLSEIFGLLPEDIKLDEETPYIWIRPREGYDLKTRTSERKIPLVGTALLAFKQFPNGFKHNGNPDSFSGNVNKHLTKLKLRPTPHHSIYSLRHTFKDRLRDMEAPEEIIDDLMGHKKSGPKYGRGHKLETKLKWLQKIAYSTKGLSNY
ncbi:DUF6538 domain-containing protein [Marinoscillum sp.]|uniref:DUF6538 domain-containing protein n=1 Tax=Marinoscillum sp. TaxID=2024838 RepID=UPI003BAB1F07